MSKTDAQVLFIADSTRFDITSARKFGVPVYLMASSASSPFNPEGFFEELDAEITRIGFDPEGDFIAMTGPAVHMALFVAFMVRRYDALNLLIFDARSSKYRKRRLSMEQK